MNRAENDVLLISPENLEYTQRVATQGAATMAWSMPFHAERPIHTGIAYWNDAQAPAKTLDYHEYLLVLEGQFGVRLAHERAIIANAGQIIFIPKGTTVHYFGQNAKVFFSISTPDGEQQ